MFAIVSHFCTSVYDYGRTSIPATRCCDAIATNHNVLQWSWLREETDVALFKRNIEYALEDPVVDNNLCGPLARSFVFMV